MRRRNRRTGTGGAVRAAACAVGALLGCGTGDRAPVAYDLIDGIALASTGHERSTIDVGNPSSRPFLERGFSWAERGGDGSTFAWSEGGQSIARFELHGTGPRVVALRGFPFAGPRGEARPQEVSVELNGRPLGTLSLEPGFRTYLLEAPPDTLRLGTNRLSLRYSHTQRPGTGARRGREIAVAWDALALLPAVPDGEARARLDAALDAALAAPAPPAGAAPAVRRGELCLTAGSAVSWVLDLGPGAELRLSGLRIPGAASGDRLRIWIAEADGPPRQLAEIADARAAASVPLRLDRFTTVRLSLAATSPPGARPAMGAPSVVARGASLVYRLSSPSASRGASRSGGPPAPAAPTE